MRRRVKTHGDGWMGSGAVTETAVKPQSENTAFSQLWALISHMKAAPPPRVNILSAHSVYVCVCVWQVSISQQAVSKPSVFTGSSSFVISLQTVCRSSIIPFNLLYLKRLRPVVYVAVLWCVGHLCVHMCIKYSRSIRARVWVCVRLFVSCIQNDAVKSLRY